MEELIILLLEHVLLADQDPVRAPEDPEEQETHLQSVHHKEMMVVRVMMMEGLIKMVVLEVVQ